MNTEKFLPYAHQSIDQTDIEAVTHALSQDVITRGSQVEAFEQAVAEFCGAKYGVAFSSGTAALMAAYRAGNVGRHDRVLTSPLSFVASIGPAIQAEATPVFLDIDRQTGNLNLEYLKYNLDITSSRGRTVVTPIHFAGIPVDMAIIDKMIQDPETLVIEDAAHALGSLYPDGSRVGSCLYSQMTVFSFHPAKTITTGEGGMVMTNHEELSHRLRLIRNNGIERDSKYLREDPKPWYYEITELSGNYNFTEMQGALGLSQLKRLNQFVAKRKILMTAYRERLTPIEHVRLFSSDYDSITAHHLCVIQIDFKAIKKTRLQVMNELKEKGIGTQVHYIPIYRHPFFSLRQKGLEGFFPETETYYAQTLSLPFYYDLTLEDIDRVVLALQRVLKGN